MIRTVLSDAQWERIAPELPGKIGDPGRSGDDNRLFAEGVGPNDQLVSQFALAILRIAEGVEDIRRRPTPAEYSSA